MACSKFPSTLSSSAQHLLVEHLERYLIALLPNGGVESLSAAGSFFKASEGCIVPAAQPLEGNVAAVYASVVHGGSEGRRVEFGVRMREGQYCHIGSAKLFCSAQDAWQVARLIQGELESVLVFSEQSSEVASIQALLPRDRGDWRSSTTLEGVVRLHLSPDFSTLTVSSSESVVHTRSVDLPEQANGASGADVAYTQAAWEQMTYAADWALVLSGYEHIAIELDGDAANAAVLSRCRHSLVELGLFDRVTAKLTGACQQQVAADRPRQRG